MESATKQLPLEQATQERDRWHKRTTKMGVRVLLQPSFGSDMPPLRYSAVWEEAARACQCRERRTFGTDLLTGHYTVPVVLHTTGLQSDDPPVWNPVMTQEDLKCDELSWWPWCGVPSVGRLPPAHIPCHWSHRRVSLLVQIHLFC